MKASERYFEYVLKKTLEGDLYRANADYVNAHNSFNMALWATCKAIEWIRADNYYKKALYYHYAAGLALELSDFEIAKKFAYMGLKEEPKGVLYEELLEMFNYERFDTKIYDLKIELGYSHRLNFKIGKKKLSNCD